MRIRFDVLDAGVSIPDVRDRFEPVAVEHAMEWTIVDATTPTRTLILVSKLGHCLNDLLFRARDSGVGP